MSAQHIPTPTRTHAAMTLGEALEILNGPGWECACIGRAGSIDPDSRCSCTLVWDQAVVLVRAAHIIVKLLADLHEHGPLRGDGPWFHRDARGQWAIFNRGTTAERWERLPDLPVK